MIFTITLSVLLSLFTAGYVGSVQKNHFELICEQIDSRFVQESIDVYSLIYNQEINIDTEEFETLIKTFFDKNLPDANIESYYYFYNTETTENNDDTYNGVQLKIVYTNMLAIYSVEKCFEIEKNTQIEAEQ